MATDDTVERRSGGIASDFEQLLTAIISHAETLGEYLSPGDPRAVQVAAIRQAAERACSLTEQLFAFSRTRAPRPRVVDPNAIVGRARYTIERMLGDQVSLDVRLGGDVRPVHADGETLQQLLYNLALSVRDAMPDGGVLAIATANVTIAPDDDRTRDVAAGEYVELSVSDRGGVADAAVQPYLFEPADEAPVHRRVRALGLAVARELIERGGGHVVASRASDTSGSQFGVLLPAAEDGWLPPLDGRGKRRGTDTVLVAAEDPTVQALIAAVLRRRGYGVLGAPDALQALRLANEHEDEIHLLITTTT